VPPAPALMSAMNLAAESDVQHRTAGGVPAAALALTGESRFAGTVTAEPPGDGTSAGIAGLPSTVSQAWVARLSCTGAERDAAVAELHDLLLRTARFEVRRRRRAFPQLGGADLDDLAWQSANDALMSILRRLGDFRGAQDLLRALREEVERLTARQRQVFVAVALNEVPIDALAERLNTTRGALYKTLHDTRRKLRTALAARGLGIDRGGR